jgi:hypothetical protein
MQLPEPSTMSQVAKKFRLLRRNADRSAVLEANDAEGWAQLFVKRDASKFVHEVDGICGDCALGRHKPLTVPGVMSVAKHLRRSGGMFPVLLLCRSAQKFPVLLPPRTGLMFPLLTFPPR